MFVHLHCHSPFSFQDGASSIESLVAQAAAVNMPALALTDHNTIAGLPEFHHWASLYGIQPISGAELTLEDGTHLTLLAETPTGYENLCRLLTIAHDGRRRQPALPEQHLFTHSEGLIVLSGCRRGRIPQQVLQHQPEQAKETARCYRDRFPGSFYLELQGDRYPRSQWLNRQLAELGESLGIPLVATSNVHHAQPEGFPVYDILSCMRQGVTIYDPSANRPLNPSRWLHDAAEAKRRFGAYPQALANTVRIAERCQVVVKLHRSLFPDYRLPAGERDAAAYLRKLVWRGAEERYARIDHRLRERLEHELTIIERLGYVDYFLTVWDIANYARSHRIRYAGRGSAADSAVAYCLYITDVDAAGRGLLFERFMSLERAEKPDIDIDFDSRRRDEVMDYVYRKYGEQHVARVATYQTFRGKSAIRSVGAALALPDALLCELAKRLPWGAHADRLEELLEKVPELRPYQTYRSQLIWLWRLSAQIAGFPRHFGLHLGGVVISRQPLYEVTSLQPSAKGEWMTPFDKDAAEMVGFVKLDLLSLRTMSAIDDVVHLRERQGKSLDYENIPLDDRATFERIGRGDTVGVFQLESPAQRALQSRLQPDQLEDIVASVALIRPGPIKGNMVDPFLRRRKGLEPISYLHPKLEPILGKTYGVVLFQEQVIEIATAIAQFTPGEADQLRRVMSHARSAAEMKKIGSRFLEKAIQAGVEADLANTIFSYIQSYSSYGFCEAHAAAFATTAYKTAYLLEHYPAEFYAAILNQYPMGYYPLHVIAAEARRRGISILGVDINASEWPCRVVNGQIRLGFRLIKGSQETVVQRLIREREKGGPFQSVWEVLARVPELDSLFAECLIRVGAFDGLDARRRHLLWRLPGWLQERRKKKDDLPLLPDALGDANRSGNRSDEYGDLPLVVKLTDEYSLLGIGLSGHWLELYRPSLTRMGYVPIASLQHYPDGEQVYTAGLVVCPHRPPTKSGRTVVFFSLEDESGLIDATMFESVYQRSGAILFTPQGRMVGIRAEVQRRGGSRPQLSVLEVIPLPKLRAI
ncbi:MAG: DNA polymerase III subunit alpha [Alicyclobacillus herbarius]|uniref:DNA polymerase III subunit alpha n=1 Tax=Alicyclobacillus herbarius TaxID=122960 RepID=UPI002353DB2C|nr:DNA polymerase III subunit alpha [Alicyclobacillus herbarius]MCL6631529.1 DNA polymerase III subunit alpha [Alicyclobacillus herbarius]